MPNDEQNRDAAIEEASFPPEMMPEQMAFAAGYDKGYDAGRASAAWVRTSDSPKVVCFCGSTRFTSEMLVIQWDFAKRGIIVHTWHALPYGYSDEREAHIAEKEGVKEALDELHKRKIDLSDEVFVINIDGYIGDSTRSEIEYATSKGVPVRYLEPTPLFTDTQEQT
jgi:hypothetical protein